jgi:hypothetical protein
VGTTELQEVDKVVERDEATKVMHSTKRQWIAGAYQLDEPLEITLDARSIDKGRSNNHYFESRSFGQAEKGVLGVCLALRVGVVGRLPTGFDEWLARSSTFAMHLDRAHEYKSANTCLGSLSSKA